MDGGDGEWDPKQGHLRDRRGQPQLGTIRSAGAKRYRLRLYDKPTKVTSTAKQEPGKYQERYTSKVSSAVWDLRRQHKVREEAEGQETIN